MFRFLLLCVISLMSISSAFAVPAKGYYRFPSIHGDTIVFAAEGDLWSVSTEGGVARRLTTHPGEESHPAISPDGRTLAFTARYEGPAELYTMPLLGGLPTRQTYEAESSRATTWTPDGELVYTTSHFSTLPDYELVAINFENDTRTRIPLSEASEGAFNASGTARAHSTPPAPPSSLSARPTTAT